MHSFQVEGTTHQTPFSLDWFKSTEKELPKAQDLFDDPEYRFDLPFTLAVYPSPFGRT